MGKSAALISSNEELYKALKRALKHSSGIELSHVDVGDIESFDRNDSCILIDVVAEDNIEQIAISLRLNSWSNPIISFIAMRKEIKFVDPGLFYVDIPFALDDLIDKINYSAPISNEEVINFMLQWLSNESHDIRNMLNNADGKGKCIAMINHVFASSQNFSAFPEEIIVRKEALIQMMMNSSIIKEVIGNEIMQLFQQLGAYLKCRG